MGIDPADDWRRGDAVDTPPPTSPPTFELAPDDVSGTPLWPVQQIVDGAFFVIGTVLVMWLGWIVVTAGLDDGWYVIGSVFLFWVLLAYVGLPRLQEVLSKVYVPDYFIGRSLTDIGVLGDPINLAVDGNEADIHAAMVRAGWTRADELTIRSSWRIVVSSVLRRPYPEAPVSSLFLFGQRQAFAYQQEVDGNPAQRHHVRFWPVPDGWKLPGGFEVRVAGRSDVRQGGRHLAVHPPGDAPGGRRHRHRARLRRRHGPVRGSGRLPARHHGLLQRLHHPQWWRRCRPHRRQPADPRPDQPPGAGAGPRAARDRCAVARGVPPSAAAGPPGSGRDEHGQGSGHPDDRVRRRRRERQRPRRPRRPSRSP